MDLRAKLADLAAEGLQPGHFLVDIIASAKNLSKITVVIDGDHGVTIDACGELSRRMSAKLDELNFGTGHYVLEVTTPGLDQPLKLTRQFVKNIGRGLRVHRRDKSQVNGKLISANEEVIVLNQEVKEGKKVTETEVVVPVGEIEKAFVTISFK